MLIQRRAVGMRQMTRGRAVRIALGATTALRHSRSNEERK